MWIKIKAILNCLYRHVSCVFVLTYFYTVDCIKVSILYSMLLNQNIFFLILLCQYLELLAWKKTPRTANTSILNIHTCTICIYAMVFSLQFRISLIDCKRYFTIYMIRAVCKLMHTVWLNIYIFIFTVFYFFFWSTYIYNYKNVAGLCHRKGK